MSYQALEESQQDSQPVLLFQFTRGSTVWRYCSLTIAFSCMGHTWSPIVISSGDILKTGEIPKDTLTVTVAMDNSMAVPFITYGPELVTTLTVFRTHYDEPVNYKTVWKGRVLHATQSRGAIELECESVFTSMRRRSLRVLYQRSCSYTLFGPGCNVPAADYVQTVTVTAVTGKQVILASVSGDINGGKIVAPDGSSQKIIRQLGVMLWLLRPNYSLVEQMIAHPTGFAVTVYPGCNKSTVDCRTKYGNLGNFGGQPGINPEKNPMNSVSNVFPSSS